MTAMACYAAADSRRRIVLQPLHIVECAIDHALLDHSGSHAHDRFRPPHRGQMSLPAEARHRWGLEGGGEVGYLDVGEAVILIPGSVENLRHRLFQALTEEDWAHVRDGRGNPDLANE
jgi:hypothetical protein